MTPDYKYIAEVAKTFDYKGGNFEFWIKTYFEMLPYQNPDGNPTQPMVRADLSTPKSELVNPTTNQLTD